jgi:hypothetical protein
MRSVLCRTDRRRTLVRRFTDEQGERKLNGLDYVEVSDDQLTITAYFLGKLPRRLRRERSKLMQHVQLEGGRRIRDVRIVAVEPVYDRDPERDDYLVVRVDKPGDFSTYTLRLVGIPEIDRRYDHVDFSFKANCPSDLDCAADDACLPPQWERPEINYLAKDYASFRQLILDRLALIMPGWQERHVPDLGVTLVELLAYVGDYLSYYQDAVATEAYLDTARQRISVRRHARLVDYILHEGCNARAWVAIETDGDLQLPNADAFYFVTQLAGARHAHAPLLTEEALLETPPAEYDLFEPLVADRDAEIQFYAAHSEIQFYTWGDHECCLLRGATTATLIDGWVYTGEPTTPTQTKSKKPPTEPPRPDPAKLQRRLQLKAGDVLIFEEIIGPKTGLLADADPARRHAVRLTHVEQHDDPLITTSLQVGDETYELPTPVVEITWAEADRLPFPFCLSAVGPAPDCRHIEPISVARGNVILVDHGRTVRPPEWLGRVPAVHSEETCAPACGAGEVTVSAGRYRPRLSRAPLTYSQPLPVDDSESGAMTPAAALLVQDVRQTLPQVRLFTIPPAPGGEAPLFELRDLTDPSLLIEQMHNPANAGAAYLRRRLPPAAQKELEREDAAGPALVSAVIGLLQSLMEQWAPRYDLLGSGPDDRHFVVEIDNDRVAQLRFGDGELGEQPPAGATFYGVYRVGNGAQANVGAATIAHLVTRGLSLSGLQLRVRNPLPAQGGAEAEPVKEVKLFAPAAFRQQLLRAITAADYAHLAQRNLKVENAAATLVWTGSWYEAGVAIDPRGSEGDETLQQMVHEALYPYRRIGHDLAVKRPHYVSLDIALRVCVLPGHLRGHVKAALLAVFSNRVLSGGKRGFFHPDNLTFGEGIYLSQLVATAQAVPGVESVRVIRLQRQYAEPNHELENGVLPLGPLEVARLDNDPSFPEHGALELIMEGGR